VPAVPVLMETIPDGLEKRVALEVGPALNRLTPRHSPLSPRAAVCLLSAVLVHGSHDR
jgi:hypothetical protein